MLAESIFLSILIGKFRKYKIRNLEKIHFDKIYFTFLAFSIELISIIILKFDIQPYSSYINNNYIFIHIFIYLFLFIFFAYNFEYKLLRIMLVGIILNFIVIISNNGFMPVSIDMALTNGFTESVNLLKAGKIAGHTLLVKETTNLWFLGDIINIPPPYPFPQTISIGDILIDLGIFLFIQDKMK